MWTYNIQLADWENKSDSEVLTGFKPSFDIDLLLQNHIDNNLS